MGEELRVMGLDHIVLNVDDPDRSLRFYCDELGLEPIRVQEWRNGDAPFPSVRIDENTIIDLRKLERSGNNVDHVCLVVAPTDFTSLVHSGKFEVVDGPGPRFGARGMGTSVYVLDPDLNVVELRYY